MLIANCPKCGPWPHVEARLVTAVELTLRIGGAGDPSCTAPGGVEIEGYELASAFTLGDLIDVRCNCGEPVEIKEIKAKDCPHVWEELPLFKYTPVRKCKLCGIEQRAEVIWP
jgi:hypothetical protein